MSRPPRPFPPAPRPPFPPTYPPFYAQGPDTQAGPSSSYDVRPPHRASYSRERRLDIHQLLRSLREDLLEGMNHTNALESRAVPYSSHNNQALATLERAWARAFAASELLRTGEWTPDSQAGPRHAQTAAAPQQDTGRQQSSSRADQRRAVSENDESGSNAASPGLQPSLGIVPVRDVDDLGIAPEDLYRTESAPIFWQPEPEQSPAYSPPPTWPPEPERSAIEDHYLDEVIDWLRQHGEEAVHERARREEDLRREVARVLQREENQRLMVAIQAFERDYYRLLPDV